VIASSFSKKIARMTKSVRISLGLARDEAALGANLPFNRSRPYRAFTGGSQRALEDDLDRLVLGWNQHLPQILTAVAEAKQKSAAAVISREELGALKSSVEALSNTVAELVARVETLQSPDARPPEFDRLSTTESRPREPSGQ